MAKGILGIFLDEAKKKKGIESLPEGDVDVEAGDLQFLMNTGPGGIEKAQRLGGFPMPSLAITRQDLPFESFGEITLVGSPDKFGPGKIKANVVFDADAYTVRAPRPFRIAKKNADRDFQKKYIPLAKEFDEGGVDSIVYELGNMETKKMATEGSFDDVVRFFESDPVADVAFLRDQGDSRPIPKNSYGSIDRSGLQKMVREYGNARKMWSKDQLNEIFEPEEFFDASVNRDFYTGKGRIFKPYTGEEVVKFMKKRRGAAQEGGAFSVGPGKLRASLTERLTSLKKIKERSPRLVDKEKFAAFKNDSYDRVNDLAESLKPFYRFDGDAFGYPDEVIELLIESEKRNLSRALDEFGFDDVPDSVIDEIQATKSYFRNAPTEYFEAKPQRLVDLEEFEGAIVPQDTPENVLKAFEDAGIKVEYYADSAERLSARKKFAGTAFSLAGGITLVGLTAPQETEAGQLTNFVKRMAKADQMGMDTDQILYHGSTFNVKEFVPSSNTDNDFGIGTYLTVSASDASRNYAGEGPDLTNRINLLAEEIQESLDNDWEFNPDFWDRIKDPEAFAAVENLVNKFEENGDPKVIEEASRLAAKTILKGDNEGVIYPVFVNKNDFAVIGGTDSTFIDFNREQYFYQAREEVDRADFDSDELYEEGVIEYATELEAYDPESPIQSFADTLRYAGLNSEGINRAVDTVIDDGGIDLTEINDIVRTSYSEDFDTGELLNAGQIMQDVLSDLGYKGVIDNTAGEKFAGMGAGRTHAIVFPGNENLIRSIFAEFDPEKSGSPNILASAPPMLVPAAGTAAAGIVALGVSEDAEAGPFRLGMKNKLNERRRNRAKKQGFDVDTVYYHGADADIYEFRMPSRETGQTKTVGTGVFMSSSPDTASSFAKAHSQTVYPVYLNKSDFVTVRPPEKGQPWGDLSVEGMTVELPDGTTKPANEVFDLEGISTDTDELARQARNQGRKGIIFKDIVDVGMGGSGEYRHVNKYLQDRGYDVSLPLGTTKESFEKEQAVPREVMRAARLYAKEKVFQPADTVVSFDPANIRSVNAEFDPEAGWSDDILASGLVTAGGIAALSPGEAEAGPLRKGISEQRLERAKKLGFDVDNVMYHASKQDIYEFVPGYPDGLVFLTPNKEFANNWLGKGKFQERQGGTGAIEGVKAERERFREEANKILKFLPEDQRQQYYEEVLFPQDQQLSRDIQEADRVIYPVVTKAKKPFVPHKDYEVLEELIGKERMDSPLSADFPQLRDGYKSGNYLLYENLEVVEFLRSKGFDSMFLQERPWTKTDTESPEYSTFAVFDPTDIRSVNAEFDPKKLSSPNILASGLAAATGIAALSPGEAEAMQKTIERVERDFPGFSADILTGAGEVALDLLGDVASPLGRASAPALLESLSQDPLTAEQIKEAAERGAGFFDYEIKTPTGKRYREAVTTGVESLFDYLSESGGSLDPVQFGFQKGVIPVLEALAPVAEAYVEGALDLDAFIRDEKDRKREKALRKSAEPLVQVLSPI